MHTLTTLGGVWRERERRGGGMKGEEGGRKRGRDEGGTGGTRRDEMWVYFIIKTYYVHV